MGIYLEDGLDHLVLGVWQIVSLAVVSLAVLMVALVESPHKDDHISLTSLLDSLGSKLCLASSLVKRATYGNAVVTLNSIAHVTTNIVYITKTSLDTVEGKNLALHLQRR